MDDSKLDEFRDLLQSCFVPILKEDLDSVPIDSEHFDGYRRRLQQTLPVLYDFVQQEQLIFKDEAQESLRLRAELIILLCEITAQDSDIPFVLKEDDNSLVRNANRLLQQRVLAHLGVAVEDIIFTHYQSKLRLGTWKRQLGTVHGFMRFLEIIYTPVTRNTARMSTKWMTFCLSVGMCTRECHEPAYKQISTRIFQLILDHGETEEIKNMNVHGVIYDAVFKDVHRTDLVESTSTTWNCLYRCLDFQDLDSFCWSCVDDMVEALLRNIAMTSDGIITTCLLKFVRKLCCYFAIHRLEIEAKCNANWDAATSIEECRRICASNTAYTTFRWAKSILSMFNAESYKLMQSTDICQHLLMELHRCYMACILPIPLPVIEPHLFHFFEKFTATLMEVVALPRQDKSIIKLVREMIETFFQQCQSSNSTLSKQYDRFRNSYAHLLQQKQLQLERD